MRSRIETSRLILRPFEEEDAEAAFGWFGEPAGMLALRKVLRRKAGVGGRSRAVRRHRNPKAEAKKALACP